MPIARANLTDGSTIDYYVPEGTTPQQRTQIYAPAALQKREAGIDPLEPPETTLGGYASEVGKGLASGAAGLLESAATGAAFLLPEEQEQAARKAIAEYGAGVQEGLLPRGGYEDTVVRKLAEATGSTIPFIATGGLGGLGGLGSLASRVALGTGVGLGAAAGSGEAAKRAEAAGATEEQISKAAGLGIIPGLGETLVPFAIGKTIRAARTAKGLGKSLGDQPAGDVLSRLRRVASAAGGEGLQEASAEVAQNLISQGIYDPETGTFTGTGESLGYGAGVGGLLSALAELAIPGRRRGSMDLTQQEKETIGQRTQTATLPPPQAPLEGEILERTSPTRPALEQNKAILPPPTPSDPSTIMVNPEGVAYPARFAPAYEEALAEEARLTAEGAQRELLPEVVAGRKTSISKEELKDLGITSVTLQKKLTALDLSNSEQAQQGVADIIAYADNPTVKSRYPENRKKALSLLTVPAFKDAFATTEAQAQPADSGPASVQTTIDDAIAQDIRQEEVDAAFAQREAQLEEDKAQTSALARAAKPEGLNVIEDAFDRAQRTGREAPGEAQLEIPVIQAAAADAIAQQEVEIGADLDAQIAAEQRVDEALDSQGQEQLEMFGPRGGVLRPTRPRARPAQEEVVVEEGAADVDAAQEEVVVEDVDVTADVDPDVVIAEREETQAPDQAPPSTTKTEDMNRVQAEIEANPNGPIAKFFKGKKTLEEGIDAVAGDMSGGVTTENEAAEAWIKANLSGKSRTDFSETVRFIRDSMGLPLSASAIAVTSQPLSQEIRAKLAAGDLRGALNDLAQSSDPSVARVAAAVEKGLGNTKIVMGRGLVNSKGESVAGLYDPKTDTITLNQDVTLRNHVLLHESMHAVTSHEVAGNSAAAQQMRNLFESVRDRLDTAYGATNLDEFIAEAFSNPEFQAKLARINAKGEKITLWSKFKNIVNNMIRKFRGQPSKKVESAMDKADMIVADLISPAPESRDAASLFSATIEEGEKNTLDALGRFSKGKVTKEDVEAVGTWFGTATDGAKAKLLDFLPLNAVFQLAKDEYPKIAAPAEELFKLLQTKNGERQRYLNLTRDTAKKVENIIDGDKKVKEVLDFWAAESTLLKTDPTKLESAYEGDVAKLEAWKTMNAKLNGLSGPQRKAVIESYSTLRDAYSEVYKQLVATMTKRLDAIEDSDVKRTLKDKLLTQLLQKETIEPYFPLYRKGTHWLMYSAIDPNTGTLEPYKEAFESKFQRDKAERQLRANADALGLQLNSIEKLTRDPRTKRFGQVDSQFAFKLLGDVRAKGVSQEVQDVILDSLFDVLPERSLISAFRPREGVLGFERDALKVFRERMPNFTSQIVNLKHDLALSEISEKINLAANSYRTPDLQAGAEALNANLQGYIDFARNPRIATWSKALKSAGFGMTLGFNVSSVLVNASNLPIVVLPYLGGKYGYKDTMKAMNNARKTFFATGMNRRTEVFNEETGGTEIFEGPSLSNIDFNDPNLSPELARYKALTEMLEARGQANISTTAENLEMENPANTAWSTANAYMGWMFHQGERFNRQVTAMASYDLELAKRAKKGELTETDFQEAADIALSDVELTNSGAMIETAPRFAQGDAGNVMMMYKRFGISMYYLQYKMAKQLLADSLPREIRRIAADKYDGDESQLTDADRQDAQVAAEETKRIAKRQIVGLFASSGLLAGVQGLPLYGAIALLANTIFLDDEDEDFDSIAASFFGEGMYSGVINAVAGVDVAPRIGMTNLVYRSLPNRQEEDLLMRLAEILGGPVYGTADRMLQGLRLVGEGEIWRGTERFLPSALSNGMKSVRYATEGATTLRGDPILEDINPWNIFAQSLGLAPAGYTKQLEINARDKGLERRLNSKRTDLMRDYYLALKEGDIDSMRDISEEMVEFSRRNPYVAISGDTLRRSMDQHRTTDEISRQLGGISTSARQARRILARRAEDLD